mmetsp:Transcript_75143/g.244325  ORF Transcript_75143/g.244325 Transcript_75143/m.244325 type:complete len:727 (+) Transcript_75143:180-2360(+)
MLRNILAFRRGRSHRGDEDAEYWEEENMGQQDVVHGTHVSESREGEAGSDGEEQAWFLDVAPGSPCLVAHTESPSWAEALRLPLGMRKVSMRKSKRISAMAAAPGQARGCIRSALAAGLPIGHVNGTRGRGVAAPAGSTAGPDRVRPPREAVIVIEDDEGDEQHEAAATLLVHAPSYSSSDKGLGGRGRLRLTPCPQQRSASSHLGGAAVAARPLPKPSMKVALPVERSPSPPLGAQAVASRPPRKPRTVALPVEIGPRLWERLEEERLPRHVQRKLFPCMHSAYKTAAAALKRPPWREAPNMSPWTGAAPQVALFSVPKTAATWKVTLPERAIVLQAWISDTLRAFGVCLEGGPKGLFLYGATLVTEELVGRLAWGLCEDGGSGIEEEEETEEEAFEEFEESEGELESERSIRVGTVSGEGDVVRGDSESECELVVSRVVRRVRRRKKPRKDADSGIIGSLAGHSGAPSDAVESRIGRPVPTALQKESMHKGVGLQRSSISEALVVQRDECRKTVEEALAIKKSGKEAPDVLDEGKSRPLPPSPKAGARLGAEARPAADGASGGAPVEARKPRRAHPAFAAAAAAASATSSEDRGRLGRARPVVGDVAKRMLKHHVRHAMLFSKLRTTREEEVDPDTWGLLMSVHEHVESSRLGGQELRFDLGCKGFEDIPARLVFADGSPLCAASAVYAEDTDGLEERVADLCEVATFDPYMTLDLLSAACTDG